MTESITVPICVLPHGKDLDMPGYATPMSAGLDLRSAISASDPIVVHPGDRCLVPTGIQIGLPEGFEAQVRPRSGLAVKHGVTVLNAPGTVDADYRGEIGVILVNHGQEPFEIRRGDRIAQLVIARFAHVTWSAVDSLEVTARGAGGFGHSGH